MLSRLGLVLLPLFSVPAFAHGDELDPLPPSILVGQSYGGDAAPSFIRFINGRPRPVKIVWLAFDGSERPYATVAPGQEIVQPTFVAHRWLVKDGLGDTPLEVFISTRAAARDNGAMQIALIR